jgi:uncharacterized lipoprotein YajG
MQNVISHTTPTNYFNKILLSLVTVIIVAALLIQSYFVYLNVSGNKNIAQQLVDNFNIKFNGAYKNDPRNIAYIGEDEIFVESVTNNVKIGSLAGNRNLEFGVKNILEEFLQEGGYDINPNSTNKLKVDIIYLDVLTTSKNISIFHNNEEEVIIRLKGTLYKDGKKSKEILVEESSSEISMSTLIVDEDGKFNQTSLSNALKKSCGKLVTKLLNK